MIIRKTAVYVGQKKKKYPYEACHANVTPSVGYILELIGGIISPRSEHLSPRSGKSSGEDQALSSDGGWSYMPMVDRYGDCV